MVSKTWSDTARGSARRGGRDHPCWLAKNAEPTQIEHAQKFRHLPNRVAQVALSLTASEACACLETVGSFLSNPVDVSFCKPTNVKLVSPGGSRRLAQQTPNENSKWERSGSNPTQNTQSRRSPFLRASIDESARSMLGAHLALFSLCCRRWLCCWKSKRNRKRLEFWERAKRHTCDTDGLDQHARSMHRRASAVAPWNGEGDRTGLMARRGAQTAPAGPLQGIINSRSSLSLRLIPSPDSGAASTNQPCRVPKPITWERSTSSFRSTMEPW